ncbi:hypothetical protein Leryth_021014 [Lithospermum erythrorhizon]|nr:hypothetical protein Leryth_021014 [Lithospermum erythrorhizon]
MAEMAKNSKNSVLERFIHKDADWVNGSIPVLEVAEVDISLLKSSSHAAENELSKLRSALTSCGCFQAINHGIRDSFVDEIQEMSHQFFSLPMEEKKNYARTVDDIEGYGTDSILSENQIIDWNDRLFLNVNPESQKKRQFWPENPPKFRHGYKERLEEYIDNVKVLNETILRSMAASLELGESCFLNQYGDDEQATMVARFNFYPPCPKPESILGTKPHADGSAITFLLQDKEVEGLQVLKDAQWYMVPIVPYALLVNIGDQAEVMSNGIFKSPVHRVVPNATRDRHSLAVFCIPHPDMEIGPAEKLIDESRPRLYKTVKNYVSIYFENYQLGKRPIEAAKI